MKKPLSKFTGFAFAIMGLVVLGYVLLPVASYRLQNKTKLSEYLSPVPENVLAERTDFTKASNWLPVEAENFEISKVRYYTISIPKLGISEATVAIGGEDLSKSLIQYPGTALPGKRGNAVIFGHSILPQFFNPKDYMSIFSTLPTVKKGDALSLRYDGISLSYLVEEVFEVAATDLEILAQNTSDSYVTLVTCTPPGDPRRPKRLIVRARLDPFAKLSDIGENTRN